MSQIIEQTNENVEAILAGLKPSEGDRIAAVGGAGCQAFALLESGATVDIYDPNSDQIALIRKKAQLISLNYLSRLTIHEPTYIFRGVQEGGGINKIYSSKVLGWQTWEVNNCGEALDLISLRLRSISEQLPVGGGNLCC